MNKQATYERSWIPLLAFLLVAPLHPQGLESVKANYTKHEYYIPMRDGIRLFTAVYIPKDRSVSYPILLNRTPYSVSPYGADRYRETIGPSPLCAKEGFIIAYQDVRGRWMSEGVFEHVRPHRPVKSNAYVFETGANQKSNSSCRTWSAATCRRFGSHVRKPL